MTAWEAVIVAGMGVVAATAIAALAVTVEAATLSRLPTVSVPLYLALAAGGGLLAVAATLVPATVALRRRG